jgi:type IV pilus assembly protein PilE
MRSNRGFTLIELMVALVILGIILGFAVPYYKTQVQKSQLADARGTLLQDAQFMERVYNQQGSYASATLPLTATSGGYSIAFDGTPTSSTYALVALSGASGTTATNATLDQNGTSGCFTLASIGASRVTVTCP